MDKEIYNIKIDEDLAKDNPTLGINQVAYTASPAIEIKGLFFSKQEKSDEELRNEVCDFIDVNDELFISIEELGLTEEEINDLKYMWNIDEKDMDFQSYSDYPKAATENAKIALRWVEENGWGSCGTPVGKARANQLAKGEPISRDTIARMAAFERHRQNSNKELGDGCGRLMWLAWGGDAGIEWAQRKLKQIDNEEFAFTRTFYRYVSHPQSGYDFGDVGPNTRRFCSTLVSRTRLALMPRASITALNSENPGFGKGGSDTYSVFNWRGGVNCKHVWVKYVMNKEGRLLEAPIEDQPMQRNIQGKVPYANGTLRRFSAVDEYKMRVVAPAMVPNKKIYRRDEDNNDYWVQFSVEEIEKLVANFQSKKVENAFNIDHTDVVAPAYIIESWIIETPEDKAYMKYGFTIEDVPVGSWMVISQITDKEFFENEVMKNEKFGYSVEGLFDLELQLNKIYNNKQCLTQDIEKKQNTMKLPEGKFEIEGKFYTINAEGELVGVEEKLEEVSEVSLEEEKEEKEDEVMTEEKEEEVVADIVEEVEEEVFESYSKSEIDEKVEQLVKMIAELEATIEKLNDEVEEEEEKEEYVSLSAKFSAISKIK